MIKTGWIACFSQTGSEILKLSQRLQYYPDVLVTNAELSNINTSLLSYYQHSDSKTLIGVPKNPSPTIYSNIFESYIKHPVISLHGWLRILPAEICNKFKVYNGHPGLISDYPELKGKDPVNKVWSNLSAYPKIGSVIHRVTEGVDEGEIILTKELDIDDIASYEELDTLQRSLSESNWIAFLQNFIAGGKFKFKQI